VAEPTRYDRLGGVFAIAAVVDDLSDAIIKNARVGELSDNRHLRVAGGPFEYSPTVPGHDVLGLEDAHRDLRIITDEFDEVAAELSRTLDQS